MTFCEWLLPKLDLKLFLVILLISTIVLVTSLYILLKKVTIKKKLYYIIISFFLLLLILDIPFVINEIYLNESGYKTIWNAEDVLVFYGSFLAFLGTVSLGALALWQNKKANNLTERIINLEMQLKKPVLEIIPLLDGDNELPFVQKNEKDYDVKFFIYNSSDNPAFEIITTDIWIGNAEFTEDVDFSSKDRFEITNNKIYWSNCKEEYDFQGYLRSKDKREFQTGIKFKEDNDIEALVNEYGGRYFLSVTFEFRDLFGEKYKENTIILISRSNNFEKYIDRQILIKERIFDNKIEISRVI